MVGKKSKTKLDLVMLLFMVAMYKEPRQVECAFSQQNFGSVNAT